MKDEMSAADCSRKGNGLHASQLLSGHEVRRQVASMLLLDRRCTMWSRMFTTVSLYVYIYIYIYINTYMAVWYLCQSLHLLQYLDLLCKCISMWYPSVSTSSSKLHLFSTAIILFWNFEGVLLLLRFEGELFSALHEDVCWWWNGPEIGAINYCCYINRWPQ